MRDVYAYGDMEWLINVPKSIAKDGFITINADSIRVTPSGDLVCMGGYGAIDKETFEREKPKDPYSVLSLAAGKWNYFHPISASAISNWGGEYLV